MFWGQVGEIVLDAVLISVKSGALFHSMSGFLALVNGTRTRGRSRPLCITLGYWGAPQAFFFEYKQLAVRDSGGEVEKLTAKPLLRAAICNKSRSLRQSRCYMQLFAAIRSV